MQFDQPDEPTAKQKQAEMLVLLRRNIETLRAMLDNYGITKEQVSALINKNWERLINNAPPR